MLTLRAESEIRRKIERLTATAIHLRAADGGNAKAAVARIVVAIQALASILGDAEAVTP